MLPTILHVSQPTEAGVPAVVLRLVRDQVEAGYSVHVACPAGPGALARDAAAAGAQVSAWEAGRRPGIGVASEVRRLAALVKSVDPDLVHLHSSKAGLAGRLAVRGRRPTVFMPHAWSFDADEGVVGWLSALWERLAVRWAHRTITVSDAERRRGEERHVHARYATVPNGVDVAHFGPQERARARGDLELDESDRVVVCVGRLCRQKGQDVLLAAWPTVVKAIPTARLLLVGGGPEQDLLMQSAAELRSVHLVGEQADPRPWYAAADVVVAPSRWEGMALVPLEAMAMDRFVVASDVAGMAETVGAAGGDLVPAENHSSLSARLIARLSDPAATEAAARASGAAVRERFDAAPASAALRAVYDELLVSADRARRRTS